ncbi:MAG: endonuclease MutS2 [Bacilli bacterium]|nr:endonuclease MutS2 [Bacilli bacterium]
MKKYHNILEFDKIIELLKEEIILDTNKENLDDISLDYNILEVNSMLDETMEAKTIIERMGRFPLYFTSNVDYELMKTTKRGLLQIHDILEVGKLLDTVKNIIIFNDSLFSHEISNDILNNYVLALIYLKNLNLRIKESINSFGEVLDSASTELFQIRKKIKDSEKSIQTKLQEIISKNQSKLTQTVVSMRHDRYVISVKNDFKNSIKGITHDTSSSGETIYIEPLVIFEINNRLNEYREEEKREIERILREISEEIAENYDILHQDYLVIEKLDLIFSKASLAIKLNCSRPKVNDKGIVEMLNCYHPLLNVPNVVTNNIIIGKDYKGIIITGPNTGGKTVLLKTIGLLSLMVKFGLLVPCSAESNLAIFDEVYADIGDEQSISQNLSTFSSHLKNVKDIMTSVTNNSLVLLDELGSGTDPEEGSALAIAIFDYLIEKKCLVIASSHYAELKVHAFENDNIINASVEFNAETLKPTYKLLIGVPGESNALKISKSLGIPLDIIEKAENYVYEKNDDLKMTLDKLSNQSHLLEKKLNEVRDLEYQLKKKRDELNKVKEETYKEKIKILENAKKEAEEIIKKSISKIEELMDELQSMKLKETKTHEIADIKHEIKELKALTDPSSDTFPVDYEVKVGDTVFIRMYNASGKVLKINKGRYEVSIGNAFVTVKKDDLEPTKEEAPRELLKSTHTFSARKTVKTSLDLRGLRYEDASPLIDDYLNDAYYANLKTVSIIHGFGTGVIRELVQTKLRQSRFVASFRYGGQNEGGNGATIVTFKEK